MFMVLLSALLNITFRLRWKVLAVYEGAELARSLFLLDGFAGLAAKPRPSTRPVCGSGCKRVAAPSAFVSLGACHGSVA
jgi:hypothetical protein